MGFSLYGTIIAVIIILPNLIGFIFPPQNIPPDIKAPSLFFVCFEKIGQFTSIAALIFSNEYIKDASFNIFFVLAIICTIVYYGLWLRYYEEGQDIGLLYEKLLFIPIPMAVFPILTLSFLAVWCKSLWLTMAVVFYAFGHLPISWNYYKKM